MKGTRRMDLKFKIKLKSVAMCMLGLFLIGCATPSQKKSLDVKVGHEPVSLEEGDEQQQVGWIIQTSPELTEEQRANLLSLRDSTRSKLAELNQDSIKLRAVLVKDIVDPSVKRSEIKLIKRRLRALEDKKLTVLFEAVDRAEKIVGRNWTKAARIYDDFMFNDIQMPSILK